MKDIKRFINEAKSGTIDQFFDAISELFMNPDFDEFWKTKIKSHFKRNKSIFKAIDYYDKWSDLLDDDRMLAGFAEYISKVIERNNFSLEQVRKFVQTEDLKG